MSNIEKEAYSQLAQRLLAFSIVEPDNESNEQKVYRQSILHHVKSCCELVETRDDELFLSMRIALSGVVG